MNRAAVLIGVKKSGRLPELRAVDDGVARMRTWALGQGIPDDSIKVLTDQGGKVHAHEVFAAVKELAERDTVEQLVVYFAGHGVNNGYSEYWLLSDAPDNPNEAINLAGSVVLAERGGIPHVVLVSDACRTRPDSISALGVTGSEMFLNRAPAGSPAKVDVFYACRLGDPAHEFGDPDDAAAVFKSIYTEVLLEALAGRHPDLLQQVTEGGETFAVVRPWVLEEGLPPLVRDRIIAENLWRTVSQTPDARVTSNPFKSWIARYPVDGSAPLDLPLPPGPPGTASPSPTLRSVASEALHGAVDPSVDDGGRGFLDAAASGVEGGDEFGSSVESLSEDFGPHHYESGAGFKIRGTRLVEAVGAGVGTELLDEGLLRVWGLDDGRPGASVLMRFSSGACAVIPAIFGYMCAVTVTDGRLVDVAYEPMDTRGRWDEFMARAPEIRRARSTLAAATRMGVTSLNRDVAMATAQHLQSLKGLDPSSSLYAAYAFRDLGDESLVREMGDHQLQDLGVVLYDLELLVGRAPPPGPQTGPRLVLPFFPMLSRGWALTNAMGATIHPAVADPSRRIPSLWTLFTPDTYALIEAAILGGDVQ
jgi:hypothetical protein